MTRAAQKSKSSLRAASKSSLAPKSAAHRGTKPDARLADADKFLLPTYKRPPIVLTHGRGAYVYDSAGKKYLDFLGGIAVNALGHAHPRIVKTIRREAPRAVHFSNLYHNPYQGPLARKLAEWSGLDRVFFSNSGTEAIEGALKLARLYGRSPDEPAATPAKKHRILAMENSFHGRTFGRSFPASNSSASTTSPISNRNSMTPSALFCSRPSRAKAAFTPQFPRSGIALAP
jgi:acetylornithine/succinyldiaminopimelate/putrescine aminotransferase